MKGHFAHILQPDQHEIFARHNLQLYFEVMFSLQQSLQLLKLLINISVDDNRKKTSIHLWKVLIVKTRRRNPALSDLHFRFDFLIMAEIPCNTVNPEFIEKRLWQKSVSERLKSIHDFGRR